MDEGSGTVGGAAPMAAKLIDHDALDCPLHDVPTPWMQLPFPLQVPKNCVDWKPLPVTLPLIRKTNASVHVPLAQINPVRTMAV